MAEAGPLVAKREVRAACAEARAINAHGSAEGVSAGDPHREVDCRRSVCFCDVRRVVSGHFLLPGHAFLPVNWKKNVMSKGGLAWNRVA